jgi:hypothetical protein
MVKVIFRIGLLSHTLPYSTNVLYVFRILTRTRLVYVAVHERSTVYGTASILRSQSWPELQRQKHTEPYLRRTGL